MNKFATKEPSMNIDDDFQKLKKKKHEKGILQ